EFVRLDEEVARAHFARELLGVVALGNRERGAERGDRRGAVAEDVVGDAQQERAVDSPRVRDEDAPHVLEDGAQARELDGIAHADGSVGRFRLEICTTLAVIISEASRAKNAMTGQISPEPNPYVCRPRPKRKLTP